MLAMNYRGPYRVRAVQKAEPRIEHPNDAILRDVDTPADYAAAIAVSTADK